MAERAHTVAEVAAQFLTSLSSEQRQEAEQEVNRFVRWYGGDRPIGVVSGHEVANYAEHAATGVTDPNKRLDPVRSFFVFARKAGLTATNLGVHLRIRKTSARGGEVARARPEQSTDMTPEGFVALKEELAALKAGRPRIAEQLRLARADKDFRENAPLDAAREQQAQVEARIRELENVLRGARLVEQKSGLHAAIGRSLVLRDLTHDEEMSCALVGPHEADPGKGKLSVASPIGRALLDRVEGDVIEVEAPAGVVRYRIERIEG